MSDDTYFIIARHEDGTDVHGPFSKDELLAKITPDADGETYFGIIEFHGQVSDRGRTYWDVDVPDCATPMIIIKGSIVVPVPVVTVTKLDVE